MACGGAGISLTPRVETPKFSAVLPYVRPACVRAHGHGSVQCTATNTSGEPYVRSCEHGRGASGGGSRHWDLLADEHQVLDQSLRRGSRCAPQRHCRGLHVRRQDLRGSPHFPMSTRGTIAACRHGGEGGSCTLMRRSLTFLLLIGASSVLSVASVLCDPFISIDKDATELTPRRSPAQPLQKTRLGGEPRQRSQLSLGRARGRLGGQLREGRAKRRQRLVRPPEPRPPEPEAAREGSG